MCAAQSSSALQKKPARRDHLARGSSTLVALRITHRVKQTFIGFEHTFDTTHEPDTKPQLNTSLWIKQRLGITQVNELSVRPRCVSRR